MIGVSNDPPPHAKMDQVSQIGAKARDRDAYSVITSKARMPWLILTFENTSFLASFPICTSH